MDSSSEFENDKEEKYTRLKACCKTRGRKAFLLFNAILATLSAAFVIFLAVILFKYDKLLDGKIFLFILPGIILFVVVCSLSVVGICGSRYNRKVLLSFQSILLFVLTLLSLFSAFVVFILAGYLTNLPGLGTYLTELDDNFQVQVFNDCCVTISHVGQTVFSCDSELFENNTGSGFCFDGDLEWSDIVSPDLCEALIDIEKESFVGNTSNSSCGNGDFETFAQDFDNFTNSYLENFGIAVLFFSAVILLSTILSFFQAFVTEKRIRKRTYVLGDPNYDKKKTRINVYEDVDENNNNNNTASSNIERFYLEPQNAAPFKQFHTNNPMLQHEI